MTVRKACIYLGGETTLFTSFHEKAHSVKADVAARRGRVQRLCPSPCFHPHFREPLIFGGSVHYEIRLFGLLLQALQSADRSLSSLESGTKARAAVALDKLRSDRASRALRS
jgi:hypothetical protein